MDDNGKCTKGFPKFNCNPEKKICDCDKHSIHGDETYPTYRRRCCNILDNEDMKTSKKLEKTCLNLYKLIQTSLSLSKLGETLQN